MIYKAEKIEPFHDFVLVRRVDASKTPSGLILPEQQEQESNLALIVEVGHGIPDRPKPLCKPGEYWLLARFIGTKVVIDNVEYILVKWADCQAKVHFSEEAITLLKTALK